MQQLTPRQLAGQRVVYAYAGPAPPRSLLEAIRAGEAAGVIFFGSNVEGVEQIARVIDELQSAALAGSFPERLLMCTDQEGGAVSRLPGPPSCSAREIGDSADPVERARSEGHATARELRRAGINVNLAPVLDVHRRDGDFSDRFGRSYSSRPGTVARVAAAFIEAQQAGGVAATAKHFPGLGPAARDQDTDRGPVTLATALTELQAIDQAPFRAAIDAGVELVMPSWARYPALDSQWPAGLSATVIEGELRGRLGFTGVTISDGIDAGAVVPYGDLGGRAISAARAGADLILCGATDPQANTPDQGGAVVDALARALQTEALPERAAREAVARIRALRARL